MHIFFNDGQTCQLLGQWYAILLQHATFTLCHLQKYAALWTPVRGSPAACGPKLAKYFNAKLWRADGDFRGDADAAAAVLALVVAFCEEVLMLEESLKPYIESTQCLQKLVCCIWACKVSQLQSTWIRCKRNTLKHMIKHGRKKPCDPNGTTDYTCKLKSRGATKC